MQIILYQRKKSRVHDREIMKQEKSHEEGLFDGFMRWTDEAWQVCYQDDAARCVLPGLYDCLFLGNDVVFPEICRVLDFLARTTAKDGCRTARTDLYHLNADNIQVISENPQTDGSWCRDFDMDLHEAYGCPHDAGWAAYASESGWTVGEILMGLMMDILPADNPDW